MLAQQTGIAEYQLNPDELDNWRISAENLARHYEIQTTQKTMDWASFIGASAFVFGTRAIAISNAYGERAKSKRSTRSAQVHTLRPVPPEAAAEIVPDFTSPDVYPAE